jgi:PTH1 family peptidyl-tRNA hydrolase
VKLVVGLGNPGKKYSGTRHNIGFAVLDYLLLAQGVNARKESKFDAEIVLLGANIFAMPTTFMNNSGRAVQKLMQFYKIASEDILVVHDDVSLDLGKLRFSFDRGAGGQHGVEDIIEKLGGSKSFHRLRIGVGPDPGGEERADYVLSKFAEGEATKVTEKAAQLVMDWLAGKQLDGTQYC